MDYNYLLGSDIIAIISLCYVIILVKYNNVIAGKKNKLYIYACLLTIIVIILEIVGRYLSVMNGFFIIQIHIVINILGFSLVPLIPYILILSYKDCDNKKINSIIALPMVFNSIICILSWLYGFVFYIDINNLYMRGPLFFVPVIVGLLYFIILILYVKNKTIDYGKNERTFLWSIFFVVACSSLTQIILKDLYVLWPSVALAFLLHYIFLREIQIKYDPITEIKNRFAYGCDIKKYTNNKNIAIVMFDLNDLKLINDKYGHSTGDMVINTSANIIKNSFKKVGIPYRIGGDEFCVICIDSTKELIEDSLNRLTKELDIINESSKIQINLAFGYSFYDNNCKSILDVVEKADIAMYKHKALIKK